MGRKEEKKTPLDRREGALAEIAQRLGYTQTADERFNNGYAHHSLAGKSAYAREQEDRLASFVSENNVTIREAVPVDPKDKKKAEELTGRTVLIKRPLFKPTKPLTRWIENFYQESPSINKIAREDQVEIATKGFAVPVIMGSTTTMEEDD